MYKAKRLIDNEVSFEVRPVRQIGGGFDSTRFMTSQITTASPFRSAPMFISPSDAEAYAAQFPVGERVPCYQYYDDPTEVKLTGPDLLPFQNPYARAANAWIAQNLITSRCADHDWCQELRVPCVGGQAQQRSSTRDAARRGGEPADRRPQEEQEGR